MTHICVSRVTIIGSDNGLSLVRCQAIIWTSAGLLLIGHLGTNFGENLIRIQTFSFKKLHLKTSSAKWRLFCLGLNQLMVYCECLVLSVFVGYNRSKFHFCHCCARCNILFYGLCDNDICLHYLKGLVITVISEVCSPVASYYLL